MERFADAGCGRCWRHSDTATRHLDLLKWGLLPYWAKEPTEPQRPINARSETAAESGMFKQCPGTAPLLCFRWPDETVTGSFAILTTMPNVERAELDDHLPVILDEQQD